jgi:RNA recognition motif-containing protein
MKEERERGLRNNDKILGFGFVEYEDKRDGEDALKNINGKGVSMIEQSVVLAKLIVFLFFF